MTDASHDLGGITRKTYLMVLPEVSIADINYTATVADGRDSATIVATVTFANDGSGSAPAGSAQVTLCSRGPPTPAHSRSLVPDSCQGQPIVASNTVHFGGLAAGSQTTVTTTFSVQNTDKQPLRLWDPEHPHLHTLQVDLGDTQQSAIRLGIRQVVLHGNTMLVNGRPIKGRGTTRHETHAFFGRSLWNVAPEGGQWERDILAFRDLNVNWIRTSHYVSHAICLDGWLRAVYTGGQTGYSNAWSVCVCCSRQLKSLWRRLTSTVCSLSSRCHCAGIGVLAMMRSTTLFKFTRRRSISTGTTLASSRGHWRTSHHGLLRLPPA